MSILLVFPVIIAHIAQPLLIRQIVLYIKDQTTFPIYTDYLFAVALCISAMIQAVVPQQIFFRNRRAGMRIYSALSSAIYKHLLSINTAALHQTTAAQIINLVANDVGKFEELSVFMHNSVLVPVEVLVSFGIIWRYIGLPTVFGY